MCPSRKFLCISKYAFCVYVWIYVFESQNSTVKKWSRIWSRLPVVKSQFYLFLDIWPYLNSLTSLYLSSFSYKIGIIILPIYRTIVRIKCKTFKLQGDYYINACYIILLFYYYYYYWWKCFHYFYLFVSLFHLLTWIP